MLWVIITTASEGHSNELPQHIFWNRNKENYKLNTVLSRALSDMILKPEILLTELQLARRRLDDI